MNLCLSDSNISLITRALDLFSQVKQKEHLSNIDGALYRSECFLARKSNELSNYLKDKQAIS